MAEEQKKSETAKREEEILSFWNKEKIFEKSLQKPASKGEFVFYDGPPFATGLPHSGSLLSSVIKDVIPRYKTMRGYHVRRRWGWDTHGLPIESLVEKKLGLKTKKDIFDIGIEKFNNEARSMVLEYVDEWKRYIERLGRWVDFDNSYKTMDASYTESVWWALKEIYKKGHLYEGYKVLMYCPHCETVLAKAEIAMDNTYKDVTDETVTVRFRVLDIDRLALKKPTFILAWTTTPWTLPGNMALAVGLGVNYAIIDRGDEYLVVAQERAEALGLSLEGAEIRPGRELVGLLYAPLYEVPKAKAHNGKKWQVVGADFVTTEDGTGVVHIAPMYGEDDFMLGKKENLPTVQLLTPDGSYNTDAPEFIRGDYYRKGGKKIIEDLKTRGLMFAEAPHTHSYPHCYRCDTRLIYNAVSSWFINIQAVRDSLLRENEQVNWVPTHLKEGRFKKIIETAPDWTISRNRFWASPLPFWKDARGNVRVVGSLEELKSLTKKSGNKYFVMRHAEARHNVDGVDDFKGDPNNHITATGKVSVERAVPEIKDKHIDLILVSPFLRTRETATIIARGLGITEDAVVVDERLGEGGSTHALEVRRRIGGFLFDIERQYTNRNILIISHGYPLWQMENITCCGESASYHKADLPPLAAMRPLPFVPFPHNADYELDYHLPYIDRVQLEDENGNALSRIPEVVDCWVESGSMPFAEYHYPFENKPKFEHRTPGDFIAEYIGQTRAWFYYMHVISVHLFGHRAFKNVVTTGNVNAADGQKISKSKKNYTDPYILFDTYGSDAFRYYFMSSVVMQAEDMQFKDEDLRDVHNKVVNILRNTLAFFELYKDEAPEASNKSEYVLDRWILLRLDEMVASVTQYFDAFDTVRATRPMRDFIEDFSTWYVRRSRDRVKGEDEEDKKKALATMRYILREFSKVIAPVMPFIADEMYRAVRKEGEPESVHLAEWPEAKRGVGQWFSSLITPHSSLLSDMREVRELVSLALEARQRAGIKVRQPLRKLRVNSNQLSGKPQLLDLIREELNVKEVVMQTGIEGRIDLDTEVTSDLKEEGDMRELLRAIQDMRKEAGLAPKDKAVLVFAGDTTLLEKFWMEIAKAANLSGFEKGEKTHVKT